MFGAPAQQVDGVRDDFLEDLQTTLNPTGASGQVHHKATTAYPRLPPTQHGVRRIAPAVGAQRFRDPGRGSLQDRGRRLGRDIARAEPGTTEGQDEINVATVSPTDDGRRDILDLIGHGRMLDQGPSTTCDPLDGGLTGGVFAMTPGNPIADRKEGNADHRFIDPSL